MRGRKTFIAANLLMLLIDVLHTWGRLSPPLDSGETMTRIAMKAYAIDMGFGLKASYWDVFQSLGFTMSIYLAMLPLLNFWLLSFLTAKRLRQLAFLQAAGAGGLVLLYAGYTITPPLISYLLIALAFLVAALRFSPASETSPI